MRYVVFDDEGTLTGSFLQDLHPDHAEHHLEVSEEIAAQWTRYRVNAGVLETFEPPPPAPVVPGSITPRQGYIILSRYGLLTPVKAYFTALEGQEGEEAKIELEFAQEWKRSWPTLINAAHVFGLTDAQIDQMFIEASVI